MKKSTIKILFTILMVAIMVTMLSTVVLGIMNPDNITPTGGQGTEKVFDIAGVILGIVQAVGISVAVILIVVIAIRYITASAEGKAEVKKSAVGYVLGAVLLFAGSAIIELIKQASETML